MSIGLPIPFGRRPDSFTYKRWGIKVKIWCPNEHMPEKRMSINKGNVDIGFFKLGDGDKLANILSKGDFDDRESAFVLELFHSNFHEVG